MKWFFGIFIFLYTSCVFSSDIAVVTLAIGKEYQEAVALGIENKRSYCLHRGYDFICGEESLDDSLRPGWSKMLILLKVMENPAYKWVFWTDADALFMDFDKPLEDLTDENYNLIITKDMFEVNPGHYFVRNNKWGHQFLLDVYSHTELVHHCAVELAALVFEMKKRGDENCIKIIPQRAMNSYAKEVVGFLPSSILRKSLYEPGDFILHFSGEHNLSKLRTLLGRYSEKVLKAPLE